MNLTILNVVCGIIPYHSTQERNNYRFHVSRLHCRDHQLDSAADRFTKILRGYFSAQIYDSSQKNKQGPPGWRSGLGLPPETLGSRPGYVAASCDREVHGATQDAGYPCLIMPHHALATPVVVWVQCVLTKVTRCMVHGVS